MRLYGCPGGGNRLQRVIVVHVQVGKAFVVELRRVVGFVAIEIFVEVR